MHGDGHRCRMARVEAELDKRLAELRHGHGEELAERRRACFFRRADECDDRLRIVARLRIDRVSALVGRLQDAQREVVRVIHRHCLEERSRCDECDSRERGKDGRSELTSFVARSDDARQRAKVGGTRRGRHPVHSELLRPPTSAHPAPTAPHRRTPHPLPLRICTSLSLSLSLSHPRAAAPHASHIPSSHTRRKITEKYAAPTSSCRLGIGPIRASTDGSTHRVLK